MSIRDKILKFGKMLETRILEEFDKKYIVETKRPTIDLNNLEPVEDQPTFYSAEESAFELDAFHLKPETHK
jgi:hypothetical protein